MGVLCYLVNLVENKHGVARACLLNALDDTSGHGADIGTTVTANLGLVVYTTKRNTYILTLHGSGNRLTQRCFTNAWRAIEAQDRRFQIATEGQHSHILKDTLLNLLHTVVILIQNTLGTLQVQVVNGIFAPWQVYQCLQVSKLHVILRTLWIQVIQLIALLTEILGHLVLPHLVAAFGKQIVLFGRLAVAHLGLDILNLLLQEVITLLLVDILTGFVTDISLQVLQVNLAVQHLHGGKQALLYETDFQQFLLLLVVERHVGAHKVEHHHRVRDILDSKAGLVGDLIRYRNVFANHIAQIGHSCIKLTILWIGQILLESRNITLKIRRGRYNLVQLQTSQTLQNGGNIAIG